MTQQTAAPAPAHETTAIRGARCASSRSRRRSPSHRQDRLAAHASSPDRPSLGRDVRRPGRRSRARRERGRDLRALPVADRRSARPGIVELATEVGRAFAREARSHGVDVVLAPQVNIQRTPVGGRHFECYSEDPLLTSLVGTAIVTGIHREGVAACVKHFIANDSETDRTSYVAKVDRQAMREVYLAPFEHAVERRSLVGHGRLQPGRRRRRVVADDRPPQPAHPSAEGRARLRRRRGQRLDGHAVDGRLRPRRPRHRDARTRWTVGGRAARGGARRRGARVGHRRQGRPHPAARAAGRRARPAGAARSPPARTRPPSSATSPCGPRSCSSATTPRRSGIARRRRASR